MPHLHFSALGVQIQTDAHALAGAYQSEAPMDVCAVIAAVQS
jgi:hypothetical protein